MKKGPYTHTPVSKPKATPMKPAAASMSMASFHQHKSEELENLLLSRSLAPENLKRFVDSYIKEFNQNYPRAYPNTAQRIALFKQASERFLLLHTEKMRQLSTNPKKLLTDMVPLLEEFTRDFPEGEQAIIHYQDHPVFKEFDRVLNETLNKKMGNDGLYHATVARAGAPSRCVEALLLQNLAKLPLTISTPVQPRKPNTTTTPRLNDLGRNVAELIWRTTKYFNDNRRSKSAATITITANALSYFDIDAFSFFASEEHSVLRLAPTKQNPLIENFIMACMDNFPDSVAPESLVRLMHVICLLSPEAQRTKYLTPETAKSYFEMINSSLKLDDTATSRSIASQLFILKNIYGDAIFPVSLAKAIEPYIQHFTQQAHGSRFERVIGKEIITAATMLASDYPGLIDPQLFDFDNPISAELGMESDVAYVDGDLKVCIQIDGDKYHRHLGSNVETQRTNLRDFCFQTQGWELVKFSDSDKSPSYAFDQLQKKVVIPSFEFKTQQNIRHMLTTIDDLRALETPLEHRKAELIAELELEIESAKAFTDIDAQLNKANIDIVTLEDDRLKLEREIQIQSARVTKEKAELDSAQQQYDSLLADLTEITTALTEANDNYRKAQAASNTYDPKINTDKSINRLSLRKAASSAKDVCDKIQTDQITLESKVKTFKSTLSELTRSCDNAQKSLQALEQQLLKNKQAIFQTREYIQLTQAALSSPIKGTKLLAECSEFIKNISLPKPMMSVLNADAEDYVPPSVDTKLEPMHDTGHADLREYLTVPAYYPGQPYFPTYSCDSQGYYYGDFSEHTAERPVSFDEYFQLQTNPGLFTAFTLASARPHMAAEMPQQNSHLISERAKPSSSGF